MATANQPAARVTFGPFEVNTSTGELLRNGIHIRVPGQPFAILLLLLERPGQLVTRTELREQIWGQGTFVDFEHGLHAAMNKLRKALGDSAENPRYIETIPGRGYRFVGTLTSGHVAPMSLLAGVKTQEQRPPSRRIVAGWERLSWAVGALVCLAIGLRFHTAPARLPDFSLTRITSDAGLSSFPALSPDGTLIAYSSDNGLTGEQDLYVRQVAGGPPVRLTFDGAGNTAPDFSPDGARIVFQSSRNGGGIYEVPALGGEIRLIARSGLNPKYSPDGLQVAYWIGTAAINSAVPGSGAVWVVPVTGGVPRRIAARLPAARQPIWLPDSKHLLFIGYASSRAYENSAIDWWAAGTGEDVLMRTGVYEVLARAGLQPPPSAARPSLRHTLMPSPGCWSPAANTVVFSSGAGDQQDLWQIGISARTGKVNGSLERLTIGTLKESYPSCTPGGAVAFTSLDVKRDVWLLPYDLDRGGASNGALERVTTGPAWREHASLASNGNLLAFASNQSGRTSIWLHSLATGRESPLAGSSVEQHFPVTNRSGDKVAFSAFEKDNRSVYVSAPAGAPEKVCEGCLRATDWSRDGKIILVFGGNPYQIDALDIASHERKPILKHPTHSLLYGRFSPDNRWISFTVRIQPNRARIAIAPLNAWKPVPESGWITISEEGPGDWADWSPDGNTIYFSSARDGHNCLWGQRIEAESHRPAGEPFPALHLHGRVYYEPGTTWAGWSVGSGEIAIALAEDTGNIWLLSRRRRP